MTYNNPVSKIFSMGQATGLTRRQALAAGLAGAALASGPLAFAQSKSANRVIRVGHQKGWLSILKGRGTLPSRQKIISQIER